MKVIFNKYKGVYSIWVDPITKRFLREDDPLTQGLTPYSFAEKYFEQEAGRYGGRQNIEIVDFTPPPAEQKTVTVSDTELNAYMSGQAIMPAIQPMQQVQPLQTMQQLPVQAIDMNKAMQIAIVAQSKSRDFLEGVVYVMQFIDPNLAQTLTLLAGKKERVRRNGKRTRRSKKSTDRISNK